MRPAFVLLLLAAPVSAQNLTTGTLRNQTAYIPPQCYTVTETDWGVANPCMTCHVRSRAPHYINDDDLQLDYSFPAPALKNPWTNLFVDRSAEVAAMPDDEILAYVRQSNYLDGARNLLAERLADLPAAWDEDGDGKWSGYVPDLALNFDGEGFDIGADGRPTGWRAFAYTPLPGGFLPTNGSADDVLIRLPDIYRQAEDGTQSRDIYKLNLAIVEALIKREDVSIAPTDETALGVDLDRDGRIGGQALKIGFDWAPLEGRNMSWVGAARLAQERGEAPLAAGLYPLGTEFIHSLRYLDVQDGRVVMAPRMKELRYMRKTRWLSWFDREDGALAEAKERADFPDRIAMFFGNAESGVTNGTGWRLQAFIEDAAGELRPQNFEETVFCMGCHGGIGVNDDDTFAFPRKLPANSVMGGWWHWTQRDGLSGVAEPVRADGNPEYALYIRENRAGDEFRANAELIAAYLDETGALRPGPTDAMRTDIGPMVTPTPQRALTLNKAYRVIVREQSFDKGRDATVTPVDTVHREIEPGAATGVESPVAPWYRMRPAAN